MYSIDLQWASFKVDLPTVEAFVKANQGSAGYVGNSADADLTLWFNNDPTIQPTSPQTQVVTPAVAAVAAIAASLTLGSDTLTAETAGAAGNVQLTADGTSELSALVTAWNTANPSNEIALTGAGTQIPAAGPLTLTGGADAIAAVAAVTDVVQVASGPSPASVIQAYWAALSTSSPEATNYTLNAQKAAVSKSVAAAQVFMNNLLVQFNTENLLMGIDADNLVDEVLTVMSPVLVAMQSGSPTSAIKRAKAIPSSSYDSKYVTAARLLSYCNQIETFLGITLSTSLS